MGRRRRRLGWTSPAITWSEIEGCDGGRLQGAMPSKGDGWATIAGAGAGAGADGRSKGRCRSARTGRRGGGCALSSESSVSCPVGPVRLSDLIPKRSQVLIHTSSILLHAAALSPSHHPVGEIRKGDKLIQAVLYIEDEAMDGDQ